MFFHVILTTECNLQCKYCYGESLEDFDGDFLELDVDYSLPRTTNYDIALLAEFCRRDPDCVLTFYGGEPLLCSSEIKQIMDAIKPKHFTIQTNGLLLDKLGREYVNRLHTILVSIDGNEALTDYYRGQGVFRRVINNLRLIVQNGFKGELVARMTVMEETDIFEQVTRLLDNSEFKFNSVHWQLNAGFWGNDYARRNFKRWSENCYVPGIERLVQLWIDYMEAKGTVLRLYPFLGIANSLLFSKEANLLRCGGGWINYAIQTDGFIIPCPTMWGIKDYYLGHISNADPLKLKKIFVNKPCTDCDILNVCGGRCLYANITKRWNSDAYATVCSTVRALIDSIEAQVPRIKQLIENGKVGQQDFEFMRYNGCEIVP